MSWVTHIQYKLLGWDFFKTHGASIDTGTLPLVLLCSIMRKCPFSVPHMHCLFAVISTCFYRSQVTGSPNISVIDEALKTTFRICLKCLVDYDKLASNSILKMF